MGGAFLFALTAGLLLWLGMRALLMINPWETAGRIKDESLDASMAMLPVTMIGLFLCLVSVIVFANVAFANERRLIDIIRRYQE